MLCDLKEERQRIVSLAAAFTSLAPRQAAAFCFLYTWADVCAAKGRRVFTGERILNARLHYVGACLRELWRRKRFGLATNDARDARGRYTRVRSS